MSEEQDEIDSIKSKLDHIEAKLAENRIKLEAIKTDLVFWSTIAQEFEFGKDEEETND
jgi:hypothetical protein